VERRKEKRRGVGEFGKRLYICKQKEQRVSIRDKLRQERIFFVHNDKFQMFYLIIAII